MKTPQPKRYCRFCNKLLPDVKFPRKGGLPQHCDPKHRRMGLQMRWLNGAYSRLQAENSRV